MKTKILSRLFAFLVVFPFFSSQSNAFDCSKALTKTEKLICSEKSLLDMEPELLINLDQKYNASYSAALKTMPLESRESFKNQIKSLLEVRNSCAKFIQKIPHSTTLSTSTTKNELYIKDPINIAKGCIATWYASISNAIEMNQKNGALFQIPSPEEYLKEFGKIKEKPYRTAIVESFKICKEENKEDYEGICFKDDDRKSSEELTYTIFFPTNGKNFVKKLESYYLYQPESGRIGYGVTSKFITNSYETKEISEESYSCSIPLKNPIIINGNIYLPEQISFSKLFNGIFGELSDETGRADSGSYSGDCLMRFRTIDSNDAYIVINSDVFTERTTSFKLCAFDITQANKIKIVEIENLLEELPQAFTIKESSVTSILKKIDKNCNKDAANLPK